MILHNESSSGAPKYFGVDTGLSYNALFRYGDPVTAGQRFSGYSRMVIGEVMVCVIFAVVQILPLMNLSGTSTGVISVVMSTRARERYPSVTRAGRGM